MADIGQNIGLEGMSTHYFFGVNFFYSTKNSLPENTSSGELF
jgi:hypothetical protein